MCIHREYAKAIYPNIPVLSPADWANGCALPLVDERRVTHQIARVDI